MNDMVLPVRTSSGDEGAYDPKALVGALIALGPYQKALMPLCDDIARIAQSNHQIRAALGAVAKRSAFSRTRKLRRADLGPQEGELKMFLEYIRFASPDFLRSVGEWPTGGARG